MAHNRHSAKFQCPWWSWYCKTLDNRAYEVGLRLSILAPAAVLSGFLYILIILRLRTCRQNGRTVALVRAFMFLWCSWMICVVPYQVVELYFLTFRKRYLYFLNMRSIFDKSPWGFKRLFHMGNSSYAGDMKKFVIVEAVLGALMFSYGFFNSLLLLILLKPFREPVKKIVRLASRKWRHKLQVSHNTFVKSLQKNLEKTQSWAKFNISLRDSFLRQQNN